VKKWRGPVLVHVKTKKGKGYKPAEDNPEFFHRVAPFHIETGELKSKPKHQAFHRSLQISS